MLSKLRSYIDDCRLYWEEESKEENMIVKGYPVTNAPVIPEILEKAVYSDPFSTESDRRVMKFFLAEDGTELVEPGSLEWMKTELKFVLETTASGKYMKEGLPKNLLALCLAEEQFEVGDSCNEFRLLNPSSDKNSFFTYRKLSESIQCAYFNENGVEFLAGTCFYPAPRGRPILKSNNRHLIRESFLCRATYPPQDRYKTKTFIRTKIYGRFCKTAGKIVAVDCRYDENLAWHLEIDHETRRFNSVFCKECLKDHFTYNFENLGQDSQAVQKTAPDRLTVSRIFESAGFGIPELAKLKTMPADIKVPMMHKTSKEALPHSELPETQDLLLFILLNPEWACDAELFKGLEVVPISKPKTLNPKTTKFSNWLLFNLDYEIPSKTDLMTQLMQEQSGNGFEELKTIGQKVHETSTSLSRTSSWGSFKTDFEEA